MEHTIDQGEVRYLEVHVQGRKQPKRVPLAACLPVPRIVELGDIEAMGDTPEAQAASMRWFYALFREYVGADIDRLTAEQFGALMQAWRDASTEDSGATPGESQA